MKRDGRNLTGNNRSPLVIRPATSVTHYEFRK